MASVGRQAIVPLSLILLGGALLVYGAGFHAQPVLTAQEPAEQGEAAPVPPPPPPPGFDAPPFARLDGRGDEMPPPRFLEDEPAPAEPTFVTIEEPETKLIREVTVGGVIRLASGELRRTYALGAPPSLCPT